MGTPLLLLPGEGCALQGYNITIADRRCYDRSRFQVVLRRLPSELSWEMLSSLLDWIVIDGGLLPSQ